ncbi:MAG: glycoside hydrolase [Chloroflexi bacterium]|nr:glycoside hydrolase [Chloroflexota bacterium]
MTHQPYRRPAVPLVEKNLFRSQSFVERPLPSFADAKQRLPEPVLPDHPDWVANYWHAWKMVWGNIQIPTAQSGLVAQFPAAGHGDNLFMWDTAFMIHFGLYARHACPCISSLDNFYAKQHDDGFICREISLENGQDLYHSFDPDGTGPNILAWAEWHYFRQSGDEARLEKVFWPLLTYHQWCRNNRTWPNGLYWATGVSSGMTNQPRVPNSTHHHRHWSWVDATMQAAINCMALEQMATLLKEEKHAVALRQERTAIIQLANEHLWNRETQFYQDIDANGRFSSVKTIGAYWALLDSEMVPEKNLQPFVQHLRDNWGFKLPHRIPTQSADSDAYNAETGNGWRGAVWPTTNYMVMRGLRNVTKYKLAHTIAVNHMQHVADVFAQTNTFWENYAPESTAPGDPAQPDSVSSAGISAISILLETVIGVSVDWPQRRVRWDRWLESDMPYGVRNYPIGLDGTMDLLGDTEKVTVTTNVPFTLVIRDSEQSMQAAVPAGTTEIDLT